MYVECNTDARSCNNCRSGKALRITYFGVCFRLSYPAINARAPYFRLWLSWTYNIIPQYLINGTIFEKKTDIEHKMCVLIFSTTFV